MATQYGKLYADFVAGTKANRLCVDAMAAKGQTFRGEVAAYVAAKKIEYAEAKDSLAIVNKAVATMWEARYDRQKTKLYPKDAKWTAAFDGNCEKVLQVLRPVG